MGIKIKQEEEFSEEGIWKLGWFALERKVGFFGVVASLPVQFGQPISGFLAIARRLT